MGPNLQTILSLSGGKHLIRASCYKLVSFVSSDESLILMYLKVIPNRLVSELLTAPLSSHK